VRGKPSTTEHINEFIKMDAPGSISPATSAQGQMAVDFKSDLNPFDFIPFESGSFDLAIESFSETNGSLSPKANSVQNLHEAGNNFASTELPSGSSNIHSETRPRAKRNPKAPTKKDNDWKRVRGMLTQLYPTEKLEVVMQEIKDKYGFEAT
jgi:hypothetical protein